MTRTLRVAVSISLIAGGGTILAQVATPVGRPRLPAPSAAVNPARQPPPVRDPNSPGFVKARELPDGAIPPSDADGNFIIGPTHNRAPESEASESVPQGDAV